MKSFCIYLLIFLFLSAAVQVQAQTDGLPPMRVGVKFKAKYPDQANSVSWRETAQGYEASFVKKKRQCYSWFSKDGKWLETKTQLLEADLTPLMKRYLAENHQEYRYLQGHFYEAPNQARYEFDVTGKEGKRYRLEFNHEGAFVKETPLAG